MGYIEKKISKDSSEYRRGIATLKILNSQLRLTLKTLATKTELSDSKIASVFANFREATAEDWVKIFSALNKDIKEKETELIEHGQYQSALDNIESARRNILFFKDPLERDTLLYYSDLNYLESFEEYKFIDFIENSRNNIGYIEGAPLSGKTTYIRNFEYVVSKKKEIKCYYIDAEKIVHNLNKQKVDNQLSFVVDNFIRELVLKSDLKVEDVKILIQSTNPELRLSNFISFFYKDFILKNEKVIILLDDIELLWSKYKSDELLEEFFIALKNIIETRRKNGLNDLFFIFTCGFFPTKRDSGDIMVASDIIIQSHRIHTMESFQDKEIREILILFFNDLYEDSEKKDSENYQKLRELNQELIKISKGVNGIISGLLYKLYSKDMTSVDMKDISRLSDPEIIKFLVSTFPIQTKRYIIWQNEAKKLLQSAIDEYGDQDKEMTLIYDKCFPLNMISE